MKYILLILLTILLKPVSASSLPTVNYIIPPSISQHDNNGIFPITAGKIMLRQHYTLSQRIFARIIKGKMQRAIRRTNLKDKDKSRTAYTLAIIGAIALFVPFLNLASIPLAILAIVIGNKAKKEGLNNRRSRTAVKLGIGILAFLVVVGLTVALVLTIGAFPI